MQYLTTNGNVHNIKGSVGTYAVSRYVFSISNVIPMSLICSQKATLALISAVGQIVLMMLFALLEWSDDSCLAHASFRFHVYSVHTMFASVFTGPGGTQTETQAGSLVVSPSQVNSVAKSRPKSSLDRCAAVANAPLLPLAPSKRALRESGPDATNGNEDSFAYRSSPKFAKHPHPTGSIYEVWLSRSEVMSSLLSHPRHIFSSSRSRLLVQKTPR